jgi:pimeloyl-ACP methyl ester carboxylesterase
MPTIRCGDINLEYYDEGSGPPLLMIMGFSGQAASWGEPIMRELRKSFRTIRFSNRGTGDSGPIGEQVTVRMMADDAVALLDALGIERAHVFGVSMGGMIAQEIVLSYPERVDGLVLGCTAAGGPTTVLADAEVREMLTPTPGLSREEQVRKAWPGITTQKMIEDGAFLGEMLMVSLAKPTPLDTIFKQTVAIATFNAYDRLPEVKAQTLVIHGDQDRLVQIENGRIVHERIPGSRFEVMPGAAHMFFWEQPEAAAALVTSFLASLPAATRSG